MATEGSVGIEGAEEGGVMPSAEEAASTRDSEDTKKEKSWRSWFSFTNPDVWILAAVVIAVIGLVSISECESASESGCDGLGWPCHLNRQISLCLSMMDEIQAQCSDLSVSLL